MSTDRKMRLGLPAAGSALRLLMCAMLGLVSGVAVAMIVIVLGAGVFWLYIYGDDPWPSRATTALTAGGLAAGLFAAAAVTLVVYKGQNAGGPNRPT
jgi:hypothetical protein